MRYPKSKFAVMFLVLLVLVSLASVGTAQQGVVFYPNPAAADQGAVGTGTIKSLVEATSATKKANIVLAHSSGGPITTYTFGTDVTIPSNITLKIEPGAVASIATGKILTINGFLDAGLYQVFSHDNTDGVSFAAGSVVETYPEWWYSGTGPYADAINSALLYRRCKLQAGKTYNISTGTITTNARYSVFDISGATITGSGNPLISVGAISTILGSEANIHSTSAVAGAAIAAANKATGNVVKIYGYPLIDISRDAIAGSIGIDASSFYGSYIEARIQLFNTGIYYNGTSARCYYNLLMKPWIKTGTGGTAIHLDGGSGGAAAVNALQIISPYISGGFVGKYGIYLDHVSGIQVLGGYIEAFHPTDTGVRGIYISGGSNVTITGPAFDSIPNAGVPIEIAGPATSAGISIINPSFSFADAPYNIKNTSSADITFIGSSTGGTPDAPIAILGHAIKRVLSKRSIVSNVSTSVARITTVNEMGKVARGSYSVSVHALVTHGDGSGTSYIAAKSFGARFAHVINDAGTAATSTISEVVETASAAINAVARDVGSVTMTVVATSPYQTEIQFKIDTSGTGVSTADVYCTVELVYSGFITPPVISPL